MTAGLYQELKSWWLELKANESPQDWLTERATKKAEELASQYNRIGPKNVPPLAQLLFQGKLYDASIFIASLQFVVRERDLEGQ